MLVIDGKTGEGGGQILRSSLALSALTGLPFRMVDIRKKRAKGGLMRQHLTCVRATAAVCGAQTKGAELRSTELEFIPNEIRPGSYEFEIGTAGSTTLVLQTVMPALARASAPSSVTVTGGTHNQMAPTLEFLTETWAPMLERIGPGIDISAAKFGFYPAGGGELHAAISPADWNGFELVERGDVMSVRAEAMVAHLPRHIAERELEVVEEELDRTVDEALIVHADDRSPGPGNVLTMHVVSEALTETFIGFGEKGVRAESVAKNACREANHYLSANVPVGEHLADQLVLLLAIAGGGRFRTVAPSKHTLTQLEIIPKFLEVDIDAERLSESVWEIAVS